MLSASIILIAACGGGSDGGTPPIVDNAVSRIDLSATGAAPLASGASMTLTAIAYAKDNRPLSGAPIAWASSNDAVASVAGGVVTARLAGTASISASSGGVTSATVAVVVTPGAPLTLGIRAQPDGAASGAAFTTPPIVEIRDAAGNAVTASSAPITVTVASGGGTLSGPTTVPTITGVATFTGLSLTGTVGARTISFSSSPLASVTSATFTLAPGAASQLALRTQPVAGTAYATFPTPAVVEIRDGAGNVTTSTASVSASLATGDGSLRGVTSVIAVAGVATFGSLVINGAAGARTLGFASGSLAPVTTASFNVASAPPAVLAFSATSVALTAVTGQGASPVNVTITNAGVFPLTNLRVQGITYSPASPANWLAATFPLGTDAPATLRLTTAIATVPLGIYTANVTVAGDGAPATAALTVTLSVVQATVNSFGTAANKISILGSGSTVSPGLVTTVGGTASATDPTVTYASRSPAIASVDGSGKITAIAEGQAWVVAQSARTTADSVLIVVPRSTGPIVRADLTRFSYRVGDTITVRVQVETRGSALGAVTATVTWPVYIGLGVFRSMSLLDVVTIGSPMSSVATTDQTVNVVRINGVSAQGATGTVQLAVVRFVVRTEGIMGVYLNASELVASDFTNLLPLATFVQYPVIVP